MSPLLVERQNLQAKIREKDRRLYRRESSFWASGGICCPGCGIPDWNSWMQRQDRRKERLRVLEAKLARDRAIPADQQMARKAFETAVLGIEQMRRTLKWGRDWSRPIAPSLQDRLDRLDRRQLKIAKHFGLKEEST